MADETQGFVAGEKSEAIVKFEAGVAEVRANLLGIEKAIDGLKKMYIASMPEGAQPLGEVMANITLAYRHGEDARMRLGKVFQALDGGVSNNPR